MKTLFVSEKMYEHPAKHQKSRYGHVVRSVANVYVLRVGGSYMGCPQSWAAKIEHSETEKN